MRGTPGWRGPAGGRWPDSPPVWPGGAGGGGAGAGDRGPGDEGGELTAGSEDEEVLSRRVKVKT